jgi:phosphohistidine phosphatase
MKVLHLLRHGKSSWDDPELPDHDRPLASRGRRSAERMSEHLRSEGVAPDLVLCSSALRARQTLDGLATAFGDETAMKIDRELYGIDSDGLLHLLRRVSDQVDSVMVIGHNPTLQELALDLATESGERERLEVKFPTGALATLAVRAGSWSALAHGGADLLAFVAPRDLS